MCTVLVYTVILLVKWWFVFFLYVKCSCFTFCSSGLRVIAEEKNVYKQLASVHTHGYYMHTLCGRQLITREIREQLYVVFGGLWLYTKHKAIRIMYNIMYLRVYLLKWQESVHALLVDGPAMICTEIRNNTVDSLMQVYIECAAHECNIWKNYNLKTCNRGVADGLPWIVSSSAKLNNVNLSAITCYRWCDDWS